VRVATTGVPPRSRRKAAQGTRAMAIRPFWVKAEGEYLEFFRRGDRELLLLRLLKPLVEEFKLGLGLGLRSGE